MKINNNIFHREIRSYENKSIKHLLYNNDNIELINIYTDGSFRYTKKHIAGYAFAIERVDHFYIKNGYTIIGKNKQKLGALYAETLAIRKAIEYAYKKNYRNICIYTDNKYIINTLNANVEYINPILNSLINVIRNFLCLYIDFRLNIKYIQGHSKIIGNELANLYAKKARKKDLITKSIDKYKINSYIKELNYVE